MNRRHLVNRVKKLGVLVAEMTRAKREAAIKHLESMPAEVLARTLGRDGLKRLRNEQRRANGPVPIPLEFRKRLVRNLELVWRRNAGAVSDPSRVLTASEIDNLSIFKIMKFLKKDPSATGNPNAT